MEIGNHSEWLGVLEGQDMLARWFINDTSAFGTYRLKGHAVSDFWDWVISWGRCVGRPSDLGYDDAGFALPPLDVRHVDVAVDISEDRGDKLFRLPDLSATNVHAEKRKTVGQRAAKVAELVAAEPSEPWVVWCETDYEADALAAAIPDAIEVRGSQSVETKEALLRAFSAGDERVIITKPSLAGFGLNWQHCARVAFVGVSYSYEQFYQAVRRCWRYGQARPVTAYVVLASTEHAVLDTVLEKQAAHEAMKRSMFEAMRRSMGRASLKTPYVPTHRAPFPAWLREVP
jgi:superfamily II DNA or RNA helicase